MVSVVAWSLIEECPHDLGFFWKVRGWYELGLMFIIFGATIIWSLTLGIALGIGISLLYVIKHATQPRIKIMGRRPGTNEFDDVEQNPGQLEQVKGYLVVKIPEPLTFANTGDLRSRLRRLEIHGTSLAHPSLPRVRAAEHNKNIIFDIHGVTEIDGSGAQILAEIVESYVNTGVRVFFTRMPRGNDLKVYKRFEKAGIVAMVGGIHHFVHNIPEALRRAEEEDIHERYRDDPDNLGSDSEQAADRGEDTLASMGPTANAEPDLERGPVEGHDAREDERNPGR
jgi:MFS superfamily sulfate permease-like transporter